MEVNNERSQNQKLLSLTKKVIDLLHKAWIIICATIALIPLFIVASTTFWLPLNKRLHFVCPSWKFSALFVLKIGFGAKIFIKDMRSPQLQRQIPPKYLYICNHQSMLDIPLLLTIFQIPPIMKKEILYFPIFGLIAWAAGAITLDRRNRNSRKVVLQKAQQRLLDGIAVQYYPEGTRSKDATPKPFEKIKTSLLQFAFKNNIPVIPVSGYGTRYVLNDEKMVKRPWKIGAVVHQEVLPQNFENIQSFNRYCWEKVESGYQELEKKLGTEQ